MVVPVVAQVTSLAKGRQIRRGIVFHIVVQVGDSQHYFDRPTPTRMVEVRMNVAIVPEPL